MFLMVSKTNIQSVSLVLCLSFFVFSINARESTSRSSQNNEEETRSSRGETTIVDGDSLRSRVPRGSNTAIRENTRSRSLDGNINSSSRGRIGDIRNLPSNANESRVNTGNSRNSRHGRNRTSNSRSNQSPSNSSINDVDELVAPEDGSSSLVEKEDNNKLLYSPTKQWKNCLKMNFLKKDNFISQVEYLKYTKFCILINKLMNNDASVIPKVMDVFKNNLPKQIASFLCKLDFVPANRFSTPLVYSFYKKACEKYSLQFSEGLVKSPPIEKEKTISFDQLKNDNTSSSYNNISLLSCPKIKSSKDCQLIFNYLEGKIQSNKNFISQDFSLDNLCPRWKKFDCCSKFEAGFQKDKNEINLSKIDKTNFVQKKIDNKKSEKHSKYFTFLKKTISISKNKNKKLVSLKERIYQLRSINFVSVNHGNINVKKNMIKKNIKIFSDIRHFLEVDLKLSAIKVKKILKEIASLWNNGVGHNQMNNHKNAILNLFLKDISYLENIESKKNEPDNSDGENDALSLLNILCD